MRIVTMVRILEEESDFLMQSPPEEIIMDIPDKSAMKDLIIFLLQGFRKELEEDKAQFSKRRIESLVAEGCQQVYMPSVKVIDMMHKVGGEVADLFLGKA